MGKTEDLVFPIPNSKEMWGQECSQIKKRE